MRFANQRQHGKRQERKAKSKAKKAASRGHWENVNGQYVYVREEK